MSKEFEEVVLKKLDELSTELKDTNQRLVKLEEGQQGTNQRLGKVELGLKETNEMVMDLRQRLEKVELDLKDNKEITIELRQRFAIFDFEINRKIDTLFDSDTVNKDNIVSLNVKNYNHDTRITNLENKDLSYAKA